MNATATEAPDRPVNVEEQTRAVMDLLCEYSSKLAKLAAELHQLTFNHPSRGPFGDSQLFGSVAWLLDQSELLQKPLLALLGRASSLREHARLEPYVRDELTLRLSETEVHFHHALQSAHHVREFLRRVAWGEKVAGMRLKAGLPAGAIMTGSAT